MLGEVSQQVRLGLHVIGSPPPPSLLSSIIKLLSQADQVPHQGGELAFWMGDIVIPNNRDFKKRNALPEARESGFIKELLWV
jgi:hypothetical protein